MTDPDPHAITTYLLYLLVAAAPVFINVAAMMLFEVLWPIPRRGT